MAAIDELRAKLTSIADAIRKKSGKTAVMTLDDMPTEIDNLETGGGGGSVSNTFSMTRKNTTTGSVRSMDSQFGITACSSAFTCTVIKAEQTTIS